MAAQIGSTPEYGLNGRDWYDGRATSNDRYGAWDPFSDSYSSASYRPAKRFTGPITGGYSSDSHSYYSSASYSPASYSSYSAPSYSVHTASSYVESESSYSGLEHDSEGIADVAAEHTHTYIDTTRTIEEVPVTTYETEYDV